MAHLCDARRKHAQLLRAEDVVHRHHQPLVPLWTEASGNIEEMSRPSRPPAGSISRSTGIATAQRRRRTSSWNRSSACTEFQPGAQISA